ncbi:MAG TPA: ribosome silencing factor [Candidatus Didemnitutus sp.]|nr:ribosome silencing factor [Candidatus Didemnitutus sp.]
MKKPSSSKSASRTKRAPARTRAAAPVVNPLVALVVKALDEKKAGDIRVLNVAALSSITDVLVVATATSDPHQRALRVELEKVFDGQGARIVGIETARESGWTVVDAFDVMVHIFTQENREKYGLENLWKDAAEIPVGAILAAK